MDRIASFDGQWRFLSNFWPAVVEHDGVLFPTVEHAYQAAKTSDAGQREWIRSSATAGIAKQRGKKVNLRSDWNDAKLTVMEDLLRQKFAELGLGMKLLSSGDAELVEGNWWHDSFWGVCNGIGENHLGRLLMKIRTELKSGPSYREVAKPERPRSGGPEMREFESHLPDQLVTRA